MQSFIGAKLKVLSDSFSAVLTPSLLSRMRFKLHLFILQRQSENFFSYDFAIARFESDEA
jgi:hypothetical protein